nr:LLM class flavin-dependent oxidoreductase [Allostreptomyces psammosilenae]
MPGRDATGRPALSVLDLAPVTSGTTPSDALRTSTELARSAEGWGYHRLWVAEHHNMPGIASSSPAVLLAHLGSVTRRIRLGSGGVMLPNHAPLVIAEQFGTLAALHPGRIDLGLGRAPGSDPATARALRRTTADPHGVDDFPEQLAELRGFLDGSFPSPHPFSRIAAVPDVGPGAVPIWLLGSSGYSAQLAGQLGLPFSFAHHFSAANTLPALELYRASFQPSEVLQEPYAMVCAGVVAADTEEEARALARAGALAMIRLRTGRPGRLPTVEEAAAYEFSPQEQAFVDHWSEPMAIGAPDTVRAELEALAERTRADEIMVATNAPGHDTRLRSYELVAKAWGLLGG